jgi:hypothetical protein
MFSGHLRAKFDLGHALKINASTTGFFLLMILILNLVVTGSIGAGRFEFVGFSNLQVLQFGLLNVSTAVLFRTALWWLTARRAQTSLATG